MLENREGLKACDFCYSSIAYLLGYCPACNDTGFVKEAPHEPRLLEEGDHEDRRRKLPNPVDAKELPGPLILSGLV